MRKATLDRARTRAGAGLCAVEDPWHAWKLRAREPGDPRATRRRHVGSHRGGRRPYADDARPWEVGRADGIPDECNSEFRRGDANGSGDTDIADAIFTLSCLLANGPIPSCMDAADANDSGDIDIADVIKTLGYLFASQGDLPDPCGACGADPTEEDEMGCASYSACE